MVCGPIPNILVKFYIMHTGNQLCMHKTAPQIPYHVITFRPFSSSRLLVCSFCDVLLQWSLSLQLKVLSEGMASIRQDVDGLKHVSSLQPGNTSSGGGPVEKITCPAHSPLANPPEPLHVATKWTNEDPAPRHGLVFQCNKIAGLHLVLYPRAGAEGSGTTFSSSWKLL